MIIIILHNDNLWLFSKQDDYPGSLERTFPEHDQEFTYTKEIQKYSCWGDENVLKFDCGVDCAILHILKFPEFYTSNACYINYTAIKLCFIKYRKKKESVTKALKNYFPC